MLEFHVLASSKVISGRALTCDRVQPYSAAPLRNQATYTMPQYPNQSHYHDTELTSPGSSLLKTNARLGSNKNNYFKPNSHSPAREHPARNTSHENTALYRLGRRAQCLLWNSGAPTTVTGKTSKHIKVLQNNNAHSSNIASYVSKFWIQ